MKKTTTKLALRSESIRQLTATDVRKAAGGMRPIPPTYGCTAEGCTYTKDATGCTVTSFGSCNPSCVDCGSTNYC